MNLPPKQQRFVEEYLIDLNATQAAIRAGYSARTAEQQGPRLLGNIRVAEALREAQAARSEKTRIDAAWVLNRLGQEADADLADLYDEDGKLKPIHEWPKIWRQGLVRGIDVEELFEGAGKDRRQIGVVRKVRIDSRVKRLELIGKHIGVKAFEERIDVTVHDALADRLRKARERGREK